jgi:hypothetical protein
MDSDRTGTVPHGRPRADAVEISKLNVCYPINPKDDSRKYRTPSRNHFIRNGAGCYVRVPASYALNN